MNESAWKKEGTGHGSWDVAMPDNGIWIILKAGAAGIAVLGGLLIGMLPKRFTRTQWILYCVNYLAVRLPWRAELPRSIPLPEHGGAVIICNHRCRLDPCIIQAAIGQRPVHCLVAQIYRKSTLIGRLLAACGTIPVERHGKDVSPTKIAIRLAANGSLVGVLPEGTINTTDDFMLPVRSDAVLIALKARVPLSHSHVCRKLPGARRGAHFPEIVPDVAARLG